MKKRAEKSSPNKPLPGNPPPESGSLSHVDPQGQARMVDVGGKRITVREALACGTVQVKRETLKKIQANVMAKGDVLGVARISGILAAKKTHELIPLCHPLQISVVDLSFSLEEDPPRVHILARVQTRDRTGVEMEAMTAVAVAALTIYDMCKAIDRGIQILHIGLVKKTGGKSGVFIRKDILQGNGG
ncbi:MAG: cyclic pyranopterin monophosphate synthase MoaC [Thermodesulfobacteriota bacterium]